MTEVRPTRNARHGEPLLHARSAWSSRPGFRVLVFLCALAGVLPQLRAQNTYTITTTSPSPVGAGANGATLTLTGTLPTAQQQAQNPAQVCAFTGYGSSATAITPSLPDTLGRETVVIPADSIQSIPTANFTAANGYIVFGPLYFVPQGTACNATATGHISNLANITIAEPVLTANIGSANVPQTNSVTGVQAPPTRLLLSGSNFTTTSVVTFGTFGTVTPTVLSPTSLSVPVPGGFYSSPVGTTAAVTVCGADNFCSAGSATATVTVTALVPSVGTLSVAPNPVSTTGSTVLTAQFKRDPANTTLPEPGAPSGVVTFKAAGNSVGTAPLVLDNTAVFVPVTTTTTIATTNTPVIAPAAGTYATAQTITITAAPSGGAIYYTLDGSAPSTSSTRYTGPFVISTTTTVKAVAILTGSLISAPATSAYTIFVPIPTSLAFGVQPSTTAINTPIAPPITVAILDQNGDTITSSTATVTIAKGFDPAVQSNLGGTTTVNAVNGVATFSDLTLDQIGDGFTLVASSGSLPAVTSSAFNVTPYPITVTLFAPLIGVTSTLPGTFTLAHPAPTGGVTVTLSSNATGSVTVSPATVNVAAGGTSGSFTYTGVAVGPATISASAPNYLAGSATVTATNSLVSLGTIQPVAPGQTVSLALSIATAAPAGGVTVNFSSSNTGVATVTSSVFIPAGQRTAATNPQIVGVTIGTTTITATAQGYAPDTRAVNVTVVASFSPTSITIPHATSSQATLNISAPAQVGGLTFTLTSDTPAKATVVSSVTIPAGQTSVPIPVTGVADGSTIIRADSPGVTETTLNVSVSSQLSFYYGDTTTGVNLEVANYVYLPSTPPTPITVTVTSNGPAIATISTSGTVVGGTTLTFTNVTSSGNISPIYIQGQSVGTTTLTITAPGYLTGSNTITVKPSGFTFAGSYNGGLSTTTFSTATGITVYPTILNTNLSYSTTAMINPGLTISVPVTSSTTGVGTITTSPVVFNGGDTSKTTSFQPSSAGTSNIAIGTATGAAGFSTSTQYTSFTATVTAPQASFYYGNTTTGVNLQEQNFGYLPVAPPSAITVTVTSSNPAVATISKSATVVGVNTLSFTGITSAGNVAPIFIQGQSVGTSTLTFSAPGYTDGTITVTVSPSGFTFAGSYNGGLSTTTFSTPTGITVYPTILTSALAYSTTATINPGLTISVPVTSGTTSVGTITTSPVVFNGGDTSKTTSFQPSSAGTSAIAIGTATGAAGFSTPTQYTGFTATVTAPQSSFYYGNTTTGVNLQVQNYAYLPVAPPSAITVTVTSSNPAVATISKSPTVVGVTTLTFTGVTAAGNSGPIYIQGQSIGTTTLTLTAPGYTSSTITVTVSPSGFTFAGSYNGGLSTTTFSGTTSLTVYPTILVPGTNNYSTTAQINPGLGTISVPVTSSNTVVGTISTSPVTFAAGSTSATTSFQPTSAGTSTIAIGTASGAAGFSTSAQYTQFTATVTAPQLAFYYGNTLTGVNLEVANYGNLPVAPPNPVDVTITSNGPSIATVSKSATVVGTGSVVFTGVTTSGNLPAIYIQGLNIGSTTFTISAAGYTNGTITVTVNPSGFTFATSSGFSTMTTSNPVSLTVYPTILNTGTFTYNTTAQVSPGLGVSVPVTSSNTSVGTITTSPIVFADGANSMTTSFKPVGTGTSTISITQPTGFSTPSQYQQITATVQ